MSSQTIPGLLANHRTVIITGSGGVGKTTVAAAMGMIAARRGSGRVLVLTVDPARRLATALGIAEMDGEPQPVEIDSGDVFWVAMLDAGREWDKLIARHAPDEQTRDAVLQNQLYRNITRRFVHGHEYAAMERLHQLQASGDWDLIVLDTPPSRNALDLLDAPQHMREFFGGRLLYWLIAPATSRLALTAFRPFRMIADRILGRSFVSDLAEFFVLIKTMENGFLERAAEVEAALSDDSTTFVVVTSPERGPVEEASKLVDELSRRGYPMSAIVVNRTTPLFGASSDESSFTISDEDTLALDQPAALVTRVLDSIRDTADQIRHSRAAEAAVVESLPDQLSKFLVPMLPTDIADLSGVSAMADILAAPAGDLA